MPGEKKLATPEELADYLGVPRATLSQWRYKGTGPKTIKVGRFRRYRWSDVEAWLERQSHGGEAA